MSNLAGFGIAVSWWFALACLAFILICLVLLGVALCWVAWDRLRDFETAHRVAVLSRREAGR